MSQRGIAFDLFGTVFDLSQTPQAEVKDYIRQVRRDEWEPLSLPETWGFLEAFPDAAEGIARLRSKFKVVTCSNAPLELTESLSELNGLTWDGIADFSRVRAYKPSASCYELACRTAMIDPPQMLMVTGNQNSPDIAGAKAIGMDAIMIRQLGRIRNIIELAKSLGC